MVADQNSKPLEIEDEINITLVIKYSVHPRNILKDYGFLWVKVLVKISIIRIIPIVKLNSKIQC